MLYGLLFLFLLIVVLGLDWLITCGLVKLICLCSGYTFTWPIAGAGVWLISLLLAPLFKPTINNYGGKKLWK